ncbi:hypothetical protein SAMN04488096_10761 [Mesonia phycicola]|uniref:Uncharacterized protein n=1 Tax=Mesonia phycicola TaxID=579105 RepID=A0A1M6G0N4_9FLAO|nr:hypothetical protein [Mesonia phycicola]SHJ03535.1 hypothetical protein SAMN04488096_10761 [Mesonia phycicola]
MRLFIFICCFCIYNLGNAQQAVAEKVSGEWVLKNQDSLKKVVNKLFIKDSVQPNFHNIFVHQNITLAEKQESYHCVILEDTIQKIRVARIFVEEEEKLFFKEDGSFYSMYMICVGVDDCYPNIAIMEGKKYWGCGETLYCDTTKKCKSMKIISY